MRSTISSRTRIGATHPGWLSVFVILSCARAPVATPTAAPVTAPPAAVPVPVPAVAVRYSVPALVTDTRYALRSATDLVRDSAGHTESQRLESVAQMTVRLRRRPDGGFVATGKMQGYAVQSKLSTAITAVDSLRFDAQLDSLALRVTTQPPLVNDCDRAESAALSLTRDVFLRVPSTLAVGDQWRDSTVHVVCRSSVPMTVRTVAQYVVTGTATTAGGVEVLVRRTSVIRLEGKLSTTWRAVEMLGQATATLDARISVLTGAVVRVDGSSSLTMTITDRTSAATPRSQTVKQQVTLVAEMLNN